MAINSQQLQGNIGIINGTIVDGHINTAAEIQRTKLKLDSLQAFPVSLTDFRVWDAVEKPLPSSGNVEAGVIPVSFVYGEATPLDAAFFVAVGRRYRVLGIIVRPLVVGSDGGAVTAEFRKAPSGTAIASGTLLHSGSADLKGTINTNQSLTLSATSSALDIAVGDAIGIDTTGTMTAARGVVTVLLAPSPSADDLMLVGGTFGTNSHSIRSIDVKALGAVTLRTRVMIHMPHNYESAATTKIRFHAGMVTTVADTTATIDCEAYKTDEDAGVGSDLVSTSATTINSLTSADVDFTLDASTLTPGDTLDVRVTIAVNDGATGTAVIAQFGACQLLCDVRG